MRALSFEKKLGLNEKVNKDIVRKSSGKRQTKALWERDCPGREPASGMTVCGNLLPKSSLQSK